jgi:uncharacterized membrane-anchored protein YjiN (DUF445 family)
MKRSPAILVLLAVMVTACSELQSYAGVRPEPVNSEECNINNLMTELRSTRSMNNEQLQRTLSTWEQQFQADPSDNHRLRLALLYAVGNESVRDPGRAQELLTEGADALNNPGDRELAAMVRQFLDDQIEANRKINSLNKQIADQGKRISELEQKQRALTNIEQKIQRRDTAPVIDNDK